MIGWQLLFETFLEHTHQGRQVMLEHGVGFLPFISGEIAGSSSIAR